MQDEEGGKSFKLSYMHSLRFLQDVPDICIFPSAAGIAHGTAPSFHAYRLLFTAHSVICNVGVGIGLGDLWFEASWVRIRQCLSPRFRFEAGSRLGFKVT